jgi:hypothetical protein
VYVFRVDHEERSPEEVIAAPVYQCFGGRKYSGANQKYHTSIHVGNKQGH